MASISEALVREYFEMNNFAVKANRKYAFSTKKRDYLEEVNLIISNLKKTENHSNKKNFILEKKEVRSIQHAIVEVKGWHTEKFAPSVLIRTPQIFNFVEEKVIKTVENLLGTKNFKRILVIPGFPENKDTRKKSIKIMKDKGIDHILEFKTILEDIIQSIKPNKNYTESDVLQTIRLLKNYNLIKDNQLELFK